MINKKGAFAIRTGALMDIRPLEQWYRMNKARNFTEFRHVLDMNAINGFNIIYADRYDTIYYLSNGKIPLRNAAYHWKTTLPGNTSATLWTEFHRVKDLPQVLQPPSGYIFNSNNTPFNATAAQDNIHAADYDPTMGYETSDNNRSLRFMELMKEFHKINYDNFKRIKYDLQLPATLAYKPSGDTIFAISETDHPELADIIRELKNWDRKANVESTGATIFDVIYYKVADEQMKGATYKYLSKKKSIDMLHYAKTYLQTNFGKTSVPLGDYQKLIRGETVLPLAGIPDVISAMRSVPWEKGMVKGEQGESYIELVQFTRKGPVIESINCYGASNDPDSPHYSDQMQMFVHQKTKEMTLNKEEVYREAKKIYHPDNAGGVKNKFFMH
jgi:acyl-homoserine-lactone acylase